MNAWGIDKRLWARAQKPQPFQLLVRIGQGNFQVLARQILFLAVLIFGS